MKTALSKRQKEVVALCAEVTGLNGGLWALKLISHPKLLEVAGHIADPVNSIKASLEGVGRKYGLNSPSTGEIVYEAVSRGDAEMHISMPPLVKPQLSGLEQVVLESVAKVLIPRGGFFYNCRAQVYELTGLRKGIDQVHYAGSSLVKKFYVTNLEQTLVAAFATGILDPECIFEGELPEQWVVITNSEAYRKAAEKAAKGLPLEDELRIPVRQRPLTRREEKVVSAYAAGIGANGGLYSSRLANRPEIQKLVARSRDPQALGTKTLEVIGGKYGLRNASIGEIVYEAVARGDVAELIIEMPIVVKPTLTALELQVLKQIARAFIPKGGYFSGYRKGISTSPELKRSDMDNVIKSLVVKFCVEDIEQVVVVAFAGGILVSTEMLTGKIPMPLRTIISSDSYESARTSLAYSEILTGEEEKIALEFIRRMGENGGLVWRTWRPDVAKAMGKSLSDFDNIIKTLKLKFNTTTLGETFYRASTSLNVPVVAKVPAEVEANFGKTERQIMLETARILLPVGGYYKGYLNDLFNEVYYTPSSLADVLHNVVQKTGTANPGQAVAYFIAHGLIPLSSLKLGSSTPTLEAIVKAVKAAKAPVAV